MKRRSLKGTVRRTGAMATGQVDAGEFVIVIGEGENLFAWTGKGNGRGARELSNWMRDPKYAQLYKSWQHADRAIKNHQRQGHHYFGEAKYCTFGEYQRLLNGEEL